MSSREPLRRSPRKRPPKRRDDQSSQRPKRNDLRSRLRRNDRPERRPKEDRERRKVSAEIKDEKTFLDVKLDIYSQRNNPGVKQKTDILSDEFDPMSFIYSDVEPPHIESQARAADCVQMLLAKWDREDGLVTGTL